MTKEEIIKSKQKSIYIIESDPSKGVSLGPTYPDTDVNIVDKDLFKKHFDKYNFLDAKSPSRMGQFFLYEKLEDGRYKSNRPHDHELHYPKLGVYLYALPCDQTIEVEWIDYRRTWENNLYFWGEYENADKDVRKFKRYIGELETEIQRLPIWSDYLLVYGVWDSMPNWKQLRQAYERTWWFHRTTEELRDIQLERLFKNA